MATSEDPHYSVLSMAFPGTSSTPMLVSGTIPPQNKLVMMSATAMMTGGTSPAIGSVRGCIEVRLSNESFRTSSYTGSNGTENYIVLGWLQLRAAGGNTNRQILTWQPAHPVVGRTTSAFFNVTFWDLTANAIVPTSQFDGGRLQIVLRSGWHLNSATFTL
jgi:hypothetical protein